MRSSKGISPVVIEERDRSDGGFEIEVRSAGGVSKSVHFLRSVPFAAVIPGDSVAEQVITTGVNQFLSLYNAALIGRLILTWFPNPPQAIVSPLATICDPYLNLFRGIIPPLGGTIDLSPILAFVVLDLFTNSATALSAELDSNGEMLKRPSRHAAGPLRRAFKCVAGKLPPLNGNKSVERS